MVDFTWIKRVEIQLCFWLDLDGAAFRVRDSGDPILAEFLDKQVSQAKPIYRGGALVKWKQLHVGMSASINHQAQEWENEVSEMAEEDVEVSEYVKALEESKDSAAFSDVSGDEIARELEKFLRRQEGN